LNIGSVIGFNYKAVSNNLKNKNSYMQRPNLNLQGCDSVSFGANSNRDNINKKYMKAIKRIFPDIDRKPKNDSLIFEIMRDQTIPFSARMQLINVALLEAKISGEVKIIFDYFGIDCKKNDDGTYIISEYRQPDRNFTFSDFGIDEDKLLENVKEIKGNADFRNSNATAVPNLCSVGGDVIISDAQIKNLNGVHIAGKIYGIDKI